MQVEDRNVIYPEIPFYRMYPAENRYLTEMEYETDLDRIRTYFPAETKEIMELVAKRMDELDFSGSRIYDEEPDHGMMRKEIEKLCEEAREKLQTGETRQEETPVKGGYFDMVPLSIAGRRPPVPPEGDCCDGWLPGIVSILFGEELYKRRCRHRRCRRWSGPGYF